MNNNSELEISTTKGDAVKAMFPGVVRLSKHNAPFGNVIVIRHDNGLETVYGYNRGWWHHGRYYAGYYGPSTYSTTTYLPQTAPTTAFIERAQEALEGAGFGVNATGATYRVEVKFSGPVVTDGDRTAQALWLILSALSADYGAQTWTARLKIYDVASGDLAMHADYEQKASAAVWGPLPILSPAGSDQTDYNSLQCWALTALTDRAMADATAYLSAKAQ